MTPRPWTLAEQVAWFARWVNATRSARPLPTDPHPLRRTR